jgi:hypothetical protein
LFRRKSALTLFHFYLPKEGEYFDNSNIGGAGNAEGRRDSFF